MDLVRYFSECHIAFPWRTPENFFYMMSMKAEVQFGLKLGLVRLLTMTKEFASTKPEDKVIALLGLAKDGQGFLHHVDYTRTASQIFQAVAETMVRRQSTVEMLSQVRHPKSLQSLPSWVPDWSFDESRIEEGYTFFTYNYSAAGISAVSARISRTPGILLIDGCIVDDLAGLGPPMRRLWTKQEVARTCQSWDNDCRSLVSRVHSYPTGESPATAHWRTRIENFSYKGNGGFAEASLGDSYAAWHELLDIEVSGRRVDASRYQQLDAESDAFATVQGVFMGGRRFCLTRKGYFSMIPTWS